MAGHRTVPTVWVGPVRSHWTPMTISPFDWAYDATGASGPVATRASIVRTDRANFMSALLSGVPSVRERPHAKVAADIPPQAVQPPPLQDEEGNNEGPEHPQAGIGDEGEHRLGREEETSEGRPGV